MSASTQTHYRACHLCEAICGLEITTQGTQILSIKGDKEDPVSHGFICPKATAIADIHNDPDRLRRPVKKVDGKWVEISWREAIDLTAEKLVNIQRKNGNDAVGFYSGNPSVHNYGNLTHGPQLRRALKTRNHFSATSLDQLPHHLTSYLMYGHQFFLPIPDIDHTNLMVILGGNPVASNGSIMTIPNAPKRFKALQRRGGKLVVIDPRRTETANIADQHHFIRPGKDAYVLMAIINTLFSEGWLNLKHLEPYVDDLDTIQSAVADFDLTRAASESGLPSITIRELAYELSHTERAVLYGRMGVSVQEFGTLCQWAIQVINILIGALDSRGGTLLTSPAFGYVTKGSNGAGHFDRFRSRVNGLPEFSGELPAVTMAEEILTPGDGQIKAMVSIAGNPLISSANAAQLDTAFAGLEFYAALDFYINATTRHADVILPPTNALEHDHYDIAFLRLAVHNSARYNAPVFAADEDSLHDWEIYNALTARICELNGVAYTPLPAPDKLIAKGMQEQQSIVKQVLTMEKLKKAKHGVDLGPLVPGLLARLCNDDGKIHAAPKLVIEDLERLAQAAIVTDKKALLLIGRRHLRSNNSWMHNYHRLVKGKPRWQLMMHPDDLSERGLSDDDLVTITSRVGSVTTHVQSTDEVMPGVVSLPHGWGHKQAGVHLAIASQQNGVNCNELTDHQYIDQLSGNAALNGVPVTVSKAS